MSHKGTMKNMTKPNLLKRKLRGNNEGQVTIDYLMGITIFIVALFFIFQYSAGQLINTSQKKFMSKYNIS